MSSSFCMSETLHRWVIQPGNSYPSLVREYLIDVCANNKLSRKHTNSHKRTSMHYKYRYSVATISCTCLYQSFLFCLSATLLKQESHMKVAGFLCFPFIELEIDAQGVRLQMNVRFLRRQSVLTSRVYKSDTLYSSLPLLNVFPSSNFDIFLSSSPLFLPPLPPFLLHTCVSSSQLT